MNEFYRCKAAVPRQARSAETLSDALESLIVFRWEHIAGVNEESVGQSSDPEGEDRYRFWFGKMHRNYIQKLRHIISISQTKTDLLDEIEKLLDSIRLDFNSDMGGYKDAAGLCGAELEKVLEIYLKNEVKSI